MAVIAGTRVIAAAAVVAAKAAAVTKASASRARKVVATKTKAANTVAARATKAVGADAGVAAAAAGIAATAARAPKASRAAARFDVSLTRKKLPSAPHRAHLKGARISGRLLFFPAGGPGSALNSQHSALNFQMADLIVNGGKPLSGTIMPSGNKNSTLPILCASLLTDEPVTLRNVPAITDVDKLVTFFQEQGSRITWDKRTATMEIDHSTFDPSRMAGELPSGMRSSVLLFAPLLQRMKKITLPTNAKGCSLGVRELDPHLEILEKLGAEIAHNNELTLQLPGKFRGARHWPDYMSVTATENFVMAAALADGESTLINAASEPHVQDLCTVLVGMGAKISGLGTSKLMVEGVEKLRGGTFTINTDYHEVVTFLALGAITGGEVTVKNSLPHHFDLMTRAFKKLGVVVEHNHETARVNRAQTLEIEAPFTSNLLPKIEAAPWPYFPVDLLPCMIALSARAKGAIQFWNKVYEGGFTWMPELSKFGAHVVVSDPHRIIVFGDRPLRPATVDAPYIIRAAVALYMVAASIPGRSVVKNADTIKRAHPNFVENLRSLGAEVEWKG
jgi:UDP-N-acetylglucosamine 1-carboxyvinyltransferase